MPQCSVCIRDDREAIDAALVGSVPLRDIAKDHAGVTISSLSRHSRGHVSPALRAVVAERAMAGPRSALDRLEELYVRASRVLDAAEKDGKASLSLAAVRELRGLVETLAKITGELDERPQVAVVNVATTPEWLRLRLVILQALAPHPEARRAVADRLQALESGAG